MRLKYFGPSLAYLCGNESLNVNALTIGRPLRNQSELSETGHLLSFSPGRVGNYLSMTGVQLHSVTPIP